MNGYIIEYVDHGFTSIEIQQGGSAPMFDSSREVLSIWDFENQEECDRTIEDLRRFRDQQRKGKA
jgi:hypothetical protein